MTQPLTYEFRLDPAETVRATRDILQRQRFGWLDSVIWQWAIWTVVVVMALLYFLLPADLRAVWALGLVAFILAGCAEPFFSWLARRQVRRTYRETPSLQGAVTFQFSNAGLTITGGPVTTSLGWDAFVDAAETAAFFLFYHSKRAAYYLPKRVVGHELALRPLRELLHDRLGDRAAGVRPG